MILSIKDIKELIETKDYNFLREDKNLDSNIVLLGLGGSYAYGTNNEDSDIDIRGIATNSKRNILIGNDFEQVTDYNTDTVIYSFDKIIKLLCSCNPNTIEILGLKPEHYLYLSPIGKELLSNKKLFLSKVAVNSFGGYANDQLRRLENKAARKASQNQQEINILKSIEHASVAYKQKYFNYPKDSINLYIDKSFRPEYDSEIYMDVNLSHYPLRDFKDMWSEMHNIVKQYNKIGRRNERAYVHDKIEKHMMHLVRLYYMCFDILEKEEINTYRTNEHDLLMSIRGGCFLDKNRQPTTEFTEFVNDLETRLEYAKKNTSLPEKVDMDKINDFKASINEIICSK